jgi:hypothetical protein
MKKMSKRYAERDLPEILRKSQEALGPNYAVTTETVRQEVSILVKRKEPYRTMTFNWDCPVHKVVHLVKELEIGEALNAYRCKLADRLFCIE